jgi:hypothetical protein
MSSGEKRSARLAPRRQTVACGKSSQRITSRTSVAGTSRRKFTTPACVSITSAHVRSAQNRLGWTCSSDAAKSLASRSSVSWVAWAFLGIRNCGLHQQAGQPSGMLSLVTPCGGRVWEDPSVYGINKRASHVPLHNHATREAALEDIVRIGRQTSGTRQPGSRLSLNGPWDFKLFSRPADVPDGFWQADFVPQDWATVRFFSID